MGLVYSLSLPTNFEAVDFQLPGTDDGWRDFLDVLPSGVDLAAFGEDSSGTAYVVVVRADRADMTMPSGWAAKDNFEFLDGRTGDRYVYRESHGVLDGPAVAEYVCGDAEGRVAMVLTISSLSGLDVGFTDSIAATFGLYWTDLNLPTLNS